VTEPTDHLDGAPDPHFGGTPKKPWHAPAVTAYDTSDAQTGNIIEGEDADGFESS